MKKERMPQRKQLDPDQKRRPEKTDSELLNDSHHAWEQGQLLTTETPFQPPTEKHAALLAQAETQEQKAGLILRLQQTYGNSYVQRLLNSGHIRAKLTVSSPGNKQEIEADQAAQRVISMSAEPANPQRFREQEVGSQNSIGLESRLPASQGGGSPLPDGVRTYMEPRFGADFSGVRMHTDTKAIQMAHGLNAQAFTYGRDIYFGEGKFDPGSQPGKHLLAHELAHVVQQREESVDPDLLPVFKWSQNQSMTNGPDALTEDGDTDSDIVPDWDAPIDADADTISAGEPTARQIGWSRLFRKEEGLIQRNGITFPSYATIAADSTVKSEADSAWQETLNATTKTSRREQGFWIKWNSKTSAFSVTGKVTGEVVNNATTAGISSPGAKPADAGDDYSVGFFHTHTPTTYRGAGRTVGPSNADNSFHPGQNVAGLVYDYEAASGGNIPAGHPLASSAKLYQSGTQRT